MHQTSPRHTPEKLCSELRALLEAELTAGNRIVECGPSLSRKPGVLVLLASEFRARPETLPRGVEFHEINDPHWWKAEYVHPPSGDCLACRFGSATA